MLKRILILLALCLAGLYLVLYWFLTAPIFSESRSLPLRVHPSAERLQEHVRFLTSLPENRSVNHPDSLQQAGRYVQSQLQEMGYEVETQVVDPKDTNLVNYIVRYIPPHLATDQAWIIVGAHYDAAMEDNPGADDNASGVAGLLELALLLKENDTIIQFPVELVFYTTEEPPFFATKMMGSEIHAREFEKSGKSVRLMYSLEMIGYYSDQPNSQDFPLPFLKWFYPTTGDFIGIIGLLFDNETTRRVKKSFRSVDGLKSYSINAPKNLKGVDFSDHKNYWSRGWPAVMITDTAFLRNDQYHKPGDTADRLNYDRMAKVVDAMYQSLNNLPNTGKHQNQSKVAAADPAPPMEALTMKITKITFSGSNPSMGPHNKTSRNSLNMESHPKELKALLDDSKVNGLVTLREYIQLVLDEKADELQKVRAVTAERSLNQGQRIIDLVFTFKDGQEVSLDDLRRYDIEGEGYRAFEELIRAKGTVVQSSSEYELKEQMRPLEKTSTNWPPEVNDGPDEPIVDPSQLTDDED